MGNSVGDAVIHELIHGRTFITNVGLVASVVPGWVAAYVYRDVLSCDLRSESLVAAGQKARVSQVYQNARCLPLAFWVPAAVSGIVTLQVATEVGIGVSRRLLGIRIWVVALLAGIYVMASRGGKAKVTRIASELFANLSPESSAK